MRAGTVGGVSAPRGRRTAGSWGTRLFTEPHVPGGTTGEGSPPPGTPRPGTGSGGRAASTRYDGHRTAADRGRWSPRVPARVPVERRVRQSGSACPLPFPLAAHRRAALPLRADTAFRSLMRVLPRLVVLR